MSLHITFSGDASVAGGYVGVGRTMIAAIKTSVRKEGLSIMQLPAARIEARVVGLQEYIHIEAASDTCALYMEAGYAQMGVFMHNRPNASDPATLQTGTTDIDGRLFGTLSVGSTESTMPDSVVTPAKFQSGEFSPKAFFSHALLNETVPSEDPYEFTDGSGVAGTFPISSLLEQKKSVVARVFPSLYSGKMRLFVQALFGAPLSIFRSQSMDVYVAALQPVFLKKDGLILGYSSGIFTADDGTYWLIELGSLVTVRRIRLTSCGKLLSTWLVTNPQSDRTLRSEFEAFIFAGATIDTGFSFTLSNIPAISPLAYGWKFNWDGSQAACVSITGATPPGGGVHDFYYISSRQTVSISRDSNYIFTESQQSLTDLQKERLRWTVTSTDTVTSPEFTYPWGTVFVWRPIYGEHIHQRVSGLDPAQVARGVGGSHEIYGWFDTADTFKAVTLEYGASSAYESGVSGYYSGTLYAGLNESRHYTSGTTQRHEFKIGGASLIEVTMMVENGTTSEISVDASGAPGVPIGTDWIAVESSKPTVGNWQLINQYTDGGGSFHWVWGSLDVAYTRSESTFSNSSGGSIAIVVPFFDSEAVYGFEKRSEAGSESFNQNAPGSHLGVANGLRVNGVYDPLYYPYRHILESNYLREELLSCAPIGQMSVVATSNNTHAEKCYVKKGEVQGVTADNTDDMFDASWQNEFMGLGNQCYTSTSAVSNLVTGSNISPSDPAFSWGTGTFIGWF